jgi:type IV pilus assembly protein PilY1
VGSSGERQDILDFLSGAGRSHKLADIYHSSPVIVTAPEVDRADESFNQFRNQSVVASRPTVVYVGTNDGVLHAFLADDFAGQAAGTELWGFIPPAVFPNLASATSSHQILLDGTPVVKDVFRARLQSALPDADEYRTVLVVGLRGGGDAYFALDVTDPTVAPVFLWQFSHPQLGDAYATPALAQVQVDIEGTTHQRSVAILPGGEGSLLGPACAAPTGVVTSGLNGAQRVERRCWDSRGRSLFVVDVTSGHLMRVFESTNLYAPMTGGVAVFPAEVGTLSTRAFMSDGDGMIWRLDLRQADMDEWAITPFHDVFYNGGSTEKGEPAYFPPVLSTDVSGNVVVLQATGNVDLLDGTSANRVVSLLEQVEYDGSGEYDPATDISATLNWEEVLDPGEQVTGPLELFAGVVYFGSFASQVSALDACLYGSSRIWGVGYIDNAPAFETAPEIFSKTLGPYDNQIVMGVAVTRRPSCFVETPSFDPYGSAYYNIVDQGGGGFELVAQISGGGTAATGGTISEVSIQLPPPDAFVNVESIAGSID